MNILLRLAIIAVCFFAAIGCYVFGAPIGGVAFILLGMVLEGLFWVGIFGRKKRSS